MAVSQLVYDSDEIANTEPETHRRRSCPQVFVGIWKRSKERNEDRKEVEGETGGCKEAMSLGKILTHLIGRDIDLQLRQYSYAGYAVAALLSNRGVRSGCFACTTPFCGYVGV